MPFVIEHTERGYCVFTQGADGEATGDPHGCHPTYAEARQQQKALYANVPEARKDGSRPSEKPDGHKSPPKGYPESRDEYADPTNYKYPLDTAAHARNALSRWGDASNREGYSGDEQAYIKARILATCRKFGVEVNMGKSADYVITVGPAVKAMGDGKVGGYLVQFGSEATKDAEGEWFTGETDFDTEFPARASVYYNHGLDPVVGRRRLTHGTMKADDIGVWVEAQLDMANRHQAAMYQMAKAGKLGWSSGSLSHITDPPREHPGGAIKSWPLGHDASLTPIPSDRRNLAIALKSWEPPLFDELNNDSVSGNQSLAEVTERWIESGETLLGDYRTHAMKAGRKLSAARRARLTEMRQMIDEMLSETEAREADAAESAPPVMGEGAEKNKQPGIELPITSLPDLHDLYTAAIRQHGSTNLIGG